MRLSSRDFAGLLRCISLAMEVFDAEAEAAQQATANQHAAAAEQTQQQTERERLAAAERAAMRREEEPDAAADEDR